MTKQEMARMVYDYFTSRHSTDAEICFRPAIDRYHVVACLNTQPTDLDSFFLGQKFNTDKGWLSVAEILERLDEAGVEEVNLDVVFFSDGTIIIELINRSGLDWPWGWPWEWVDGICLSQEEFVRLFGGKEIES
jgi:hypothetical protein